MKRKLDDFPAGNEKISLYSLIVQPSSQELHVKEIRS